MENATQHHLSRLVRAHGTYSHVARFLGITPRYMRRVRSADMSSSCKRTLLMAGKLLLLRQILSELRASGALSSAQLSAACKRVCRGE